MMVKKDKGFTLLEVVVTLAILATALVVIISQVGKGIDLSTEAKFMSLSAILAKSKMAEIEISGYPPISNQNGDFGEGHPGFSWTSQVSETNIDGIRQVVVTVRWGEGFYQKEFTVTNYLFKEG